jgi:hypothetical protein
MEEISKEEFYRKIGTIHKVTEDLLAQLSFTLGISLFSHFFNSKELGEIITKPTIVKILDFFPLNEGFTLLEIASIVGHSFFFGDCDSNLSCVLLRGTSIGSYLVRYSSKSGYLTLSANFGAEIKHWRMKYKKDPTNEKMFFSIGSKSFTSLVELIDYYSKNKLPSNLSTVLILGQPCNRNDFVKELKPLQSYHETI